MLNERIFWENLTPLDSSHLEVFLVIFLGIFHFFEFKFEFWILAGWVPAGTGYRSNRSGPVPVWSGTKPAQIQNLNLNSKKWKILKKIPKNTSRCDEFNGVKFSQKFVHLV